MTASGPEHLRQVRALFDAVMEHPADSRLDFLDKEVSWDRTVREEVAALLTIAERTTPALEPSPSTDEALAAAHAAELVGQRLGPWTIVRLIGGGGMGAVYEAVRADAEYSQRVAIKLVQRGLGSEITFARFRRERQILASLDHPGIATLLDGGVAPDGRPFLVMEYVAGEPITTWCDSQNLPVAARLDLFRQVCKAVRYAHLNLVLHRDLKPGNILVTSDGAVKLLDFGIAKLLDEEADDAAPLTRVGARALTPEYASPEQIAGESLTTASDIYSLGVVLFELLAGRRPHATSGQALADLEHEILKGIPPRPSTLVTNAAAVLRGEREESRLAQRLRGDLDQITLMALRRDPGRRYDSAEALSEDIKRHLAGRPVEAEADRLGYRMGKFVHRNRLATAAAVTLVLALFGGIAATSTMAHRAQEAQALSEEVSGFLRQLLSSVRPVTGGRDVPVSELLDSASTRLATDLADRPDLRNELEMVLGWSYQALGRFPEAERHMREAVALRQRLHGSRSLPVVMALNALGTTLLDQGLTEAADSAFQEALGLRRSLRIPPDTSLASLLGNLGSLAHARGETTEAEGYHRESLELRRRIGGPADDGLAAAINNVAVSLGDQNRWDEAEAMHREALDILQDNHPEGDTQVADALGALATALDLQGKNEEAESAYLETLELRLRLLGPEHPQYTFTLFNFAGFIFDRGRYEEAAALSREILALRGRVLPDNHPAVAHALQTLGRCLDQLDDHAGARAALSESLELRQQHAPPGGWLIASSESVLGEHYMIAGELERAEALMLGADEVMSRLLGADSPRTLVNVERLVVLYDRWNRPVDADRYRARLAK